MTTTIKIHVGGAYRTTVKHGDQTTVIYGDGVQGRTGDHFFYLGHPATGTFEISEEYIGDKPNLMAEGIILGPVGATGATGATGAIDARFLPDAGQ